MAWEENRACAISLILSTVTRRDRLAGALL